MKSLLLTSLWSVAFALNALGQSPSIAPSLSPMISPSATAAAVSGAVAAPPPVTAFPTAAPSQSAISPAAATSATPRDPLAERIQRDVRKQFKKHHFSMTVGDSGDEEDKDNDNDENRHHSSNDAIPDAVIPIVALSVFALFATPIGIVFVIMYFSMSKSRALHRTVRAMVEKGQEVPAALLNPPPAVRQRSDMRRGIVLLMIGLGVMLFLAAVNDWEGGAWSIGLIPFLIGAGYLLVWKLEGKKDNVPPLP
ncbi:MAG: hypothetical protein H0U99_10675 [Chthoniobacterales bacterium]|nr:hypothetical protein [Chthoniobacterales bacterium]